MLSLTIARFSADPDRVTELLQITPSSVQREGESTETGRVIRFNTWSLELHQEPLTDGQAHESAIAALIDRLRGREPLFVELAKSISPKSVSIYGAFYVSDEQQGVWLEPAQMAVLAACGIGWGLDLLEAVMLN